MMFKVPIGKVDVTDAEKRAVMDVLNSGHLSPGPKVTEFEKKFADYVCAKYGVLVNSGTDALRIALLAMKEHYGWADGDEVIVPALTFVATVNTVLQAGLKPVFVDVEGINSPETPYCMDTAYPVGDAITTRTRCILPVHLFGCRAFSEHSPLSGHTNNVIRILEDSCESLMPLYGDAACFSFYVCHLLSLGVGGMAVTNDRKIEKLMRSYANHGRDPSFLGTQVSDSPENLFTRFSFERLGYSSRITEMQAAMGLEQLKTIDERLAKRRQTALALCAKMGVFKNQLNITEYAEHLNSHWMMFPIVLSDERVDIKRFCNDLEMLGIETRPLMPLLTQPLYRKLFPGEYKRHINAWRISERGFYIGCHEYMTSDDIDYVGDCFWECLNRQKAKVAQVA